ncbi:hypothetical protein FHN55_03655 [Streptomyces sp. NP160]|uniref:hypothetical protein n=1 Tax=Streptomyces sp. NP160 TaxID=2586637 RepID=UPI001118A221|nr:hypothetical protein [Streptomyces sp. NP160]TNM69416.1 hypothetical protein FHN55_03655 [Streptomyces sp. NP160]
MSASQEPAPDAAATLGVPTTHREPRELSARMAAEAVRRVHALEDVPADAPLEPHPDAKAPGANFIDVRDDHSHPRYWVGMSGEVLATQTAPGPGAGPVVKRARARYAAAVEAVRLRHRVPVSTELFATPDAFVDGAFFVHEAPSADGGAAVRWVDGAGEVHDGYRLVDGETRWEPSTVAARRDALRAQPATAALVDAD